MEVAGIVFAALGFLNQAINTSALLSKLAHDTSGIGTKMVSATTRLNAQRLALQLWHEKWANKVGRTHETSITTANREVLYQRIWGLDGYKMIVQCLAQLSIKMGEASRTLSLIDPDSLVGTEKMSPLIDPEPLIGTKSAHQKMSFRHFLRQSSGENATKPKFSKLWHRHSKSSDAARSSIPDTGSKKNLYMQSSVEEEARTQAEALRLQLGPGTKFKWSIVLKDELGSALQEIDDWLNRLQTLSDRCGELRDHADEHPSMNHSSIRAAARALYLALPDRLRLPVAPRIDLKLEMERVNTKYFNRNFGGITYVDRTNTSFKFPILITDTTTVNSRFFLVAEAINSKMADSIPDNVRLFEEEAVIEDLLASLSRPDMGPDSPSVIISHLDNPNSIVVHAVPEHNKNIKPLL
ncbi:hypothetical protein JMJ35_009393 [Cladonia borealis]|uniref:Uncharacterized protein n=1 Tax=Cladonia borealis TaxID=184061 RepID=A0AA39QUT5_9LECA|nr:hypothetical protein JMJ35_009393 [Cladonia borealis]